jgi:hypothetical protein
LATGAATGSTVTVMSSVDDEAPAVAVAVSRKVSVVAVTGAVNMATVPHPCGHGAACGRGHVHRRRYRCDVGEHLGAHIDRPDRAGLRTEHCKSRAGQ